jgi:anti-sigma regulatory factor (Ser/Thr protein kinase)
VSTRKTDHTREIARMAADAIAYRSHDDCEACQVSTTGECETAQGTCGPSAHRGPCPRRKLGDRVHAAADDRARALGWEVTETPGRLRLSGRSYRDPDSPPGGRTARTRTPEGMDAMTDRPPAREPGAGQAAGADGATLRTELPADLTSARQARSAVRKALAAWGMDHLADDAELLASELVANAAEHGDGKPIGLALRRHGEPGGQPGITCEVTDGSPALPWRPDPGPDSERGRGLAIVNALARSSGVRASQAGKTSWFTLALTDRAHRVARQIEHQPEAGA